MKIVTDIVAQVQGLDPGLPQLSGEVSMGMPWLIVAVAVAGILVIAFKTSGRSHLD
jgi:hypothetical protein